MRLAFIRGALFCAVGALSLLSPARIEAAVVEPPLVLNISEQIVWAAPSPFPGATLTGSSQFETDSGTFGAQTYSISYPPDPIYPPEPIEVSFSAVQIDWGDSIAWSFTGTLATAGGGSFASAACPASDETPPDPCNQATVADSLTGGFTAFDISGPVYAFDSPVRIGTWTISIAEAPEASTWMLLCAGLAALTGIRRLPLGSRRHRRPTVG